MFFAYIAAYSKYIDCWIVFQGHKVCDLQAGDSRAAPINNYYLCGVIFVTPNAGSSQTSQKHRTHDWKL